MCVSSVSVDLTGDGNDLAQLYPTGMQAKAALCTERFSVIADTGYSSGEHGALCDAAKIIVIVPRPETVNPRGEALFSRDAFVYDADSDSYRCPAGQTLGLRKVSRTEKKKDYWNAAACRECLLKLQCTEVKKRSIVRSFYEDDRAAMHQRATSNPTWMKLRMRPVGHPIGTMKAMMGCPRFLLRGALKAELALAVLGHNLKRVINLLGGTNLCRRRRDATV